MNKGLALIFMVSTAFAGFSSDFNNYEMEIVRTLSIENDLPGLIEDPYHAVVGIASLGEDRFLLNAPNIEVSYILGEGRVETILRDTYLSAYEILFLADDGFFGLNAAGTLTKTNWAGDVEYHLNARRVQEMGASIDIYAPVITDCGVFYWDAKGNIHAFLHTDPEVRDLVHFNVSEIREMFEPCSPRFSIDQDQRLFVNGEYRNSNSRTYIRYWQEERAVPANHSNGFTDEELSTLPRLRFIGTDSSGNTYWDIARYGVLVMSDRGVVVDLFTYDVGLITPPPHVSENGDIYFVGRDEQSVYIYTIRRRW